MKDLCRVLEIHFEGCFFTWSNKRHGDTLVLERLDRCFANSEARQVFPNYIISISSTVGSDHCPLIMDVVPHIIIYYHPS